MSSFEELDNKLRASSIDELKQIIASSDMPSDVLQRAGRELEALSSMSPGTAGHTNGIRYIKYLLSLPWNEKTENNPGLQRIEAVLNESRHVSQNIRERILAHLAVKLLNEDRKPRILVVDDEKIALESLAYILTGEGYEVVQAHSGADAIEKLKVSGFDAILTDLIMGDVDGNAVLKEVRNRSADTPVIMITGYATVDTAVESLRMGAFHYIEKPIRLDEVRGAVKEALNKKLPADKGSVICLAGGSEADRTSLGKTIAEALGRKFSRISLAGIKDKSEIIGESRTTDGAMPGSIIEEICRTGVANPVIMLDGLDMTGEHFKKGIASALLDVLDPGKNQRFIDRFLGVPFNLSNVMFVVTTNNAGNIQNPLRDLLEIIEI